jgi:hypothetical protein
MARSGIAGATSFDVLPWTGGRKTTGYEERDEGGDETMRPNGEVPRPNGQLSSTSLSTWCILTST